MWGVVSYNITKRFTPYSDRVYARKRCRRCPSPRVFEKRRRTDDGLSVDQGVRVGVHCDLLGGRDPSGSVGRDEVRASVEERVRVGELTAGERGVRHCSRSASARSAILVIDPSE